MEQALTLTVLGMGTVLVVLYVINLMIVVMGKIFAVKSAPALPETIPTVGTYQPEESAANDDELVAAAISAIYMCMDDGPKKNRIARNTNTAYE